MTASLPITAARLIITAKCFVKAPAREAARVSSQVNPRMEFDRKTSVHSLTQKIGV
jgi:hypothetical protein